MVARLTPDQKGLGLLRFYLYQQDGLGVSLSIMEFL
ncbi:hypothetical protein CCACVL1_05279 [Corchorus capsularis]|uniref:Uncharacterized protein n=1 Tax=Corchorus capsularis TaxID=210143 RepID=A0A1R3JLM9_COCAP|nr:hypothetical protein CCACVL1_05279 [Corchorus capsularis]